MLTEKQLSLLRLTFALAFLVVGLTYSFFLFNRSSLDIHFTVTTQLVLLVLGLFLVKTSQFSVLSRLFLFVFCLPFLHGIEHWGYDFSETWDNMVWGLMGNAYNTDRTIVEMLFMVGVAGTSALVSGLLLASNLPSSLFAKLSRPGFCPKLNYLQYVVFCLLAIVLTYFSAQPQTVLTSNYGEQQSALESYNMNSGWLLAFTLFLGLFIKTMDAENKREKTMKMVILAVTLLIIVVPVQLLRGERESISLVGTLLLLILFPIGKRIATQLLMKRIAFLALLSLPVILFAQVLGEVRSIASSGNFWDLWTYSDHRYFTGTWTGSLLSILSVTGDKYLGLSGLLAGNTYLDYLYSLPPGFLTRLLGIERPIDGTGGLAWQMRFGIGGTNISVVPLLNFGVFGMFLFLLMTGFMVGVIERRANFHPTFGNKLLLSVMLLLAPFWIWYGDMYFIRGMMIFVIVYFLLFILSKDTKKEQSLEEFTVCGQNT